MASSVDNTKLNEYQTSLTNSRNQDAVALKSSITTLAVLTLTTATAGILIALHPSLIAVVIKAGGTVFAVGLTFVGGNLFLTITKKKQAEELLNDALDILKEATDPTVRETIINNMSQEQFNTLLGNEKLKGETKVLQSLAKFPDKLGAARRENVNLEYLSNVQEHVNSSEKENKSTLSNVKPLDTKLSAAFKKKTQWERVAGEIAEVFKGVIFLALALIITGVCMYTSHHVTALILEGLAGGSLAATISPGFFAKYKAHSHEKIILDGLEKPYEFLHTNFCNNIQTFVTEMSQDQLNKLITDPRLIDTAKKITSNAELSPGQMRDKYLIKEIAKTKDLDLGYASTEIREAIRFFSSEN